MSPITYYRLALIIPFAVPALVYLFGSNSWLFGLLFFSVAFGGPAYLVFAILMFVWVGKSSTHSEIQKLTLKAPLLFIPIQSISWLAYFYYEKLSNPNLTDGWGALLPFSFYILILGYAYVLIVNILYSLLYKVGLIDGGDHTNNSFKSTPKSGAI